MARHSVRWCGRGGENHSDWNWLKQAIALSLAAIALISVKPAAALDSTRPKRVLILFSNDRLLPADTRVDEGLRSVLEKDLERPVTLFTEFLDSIRFPGEERHELMANYLRARYAKNSPDVIVSIGSQATRFFLSRRESLFAGTPLVCGAVSQPSLDTGYPMAGLTGKTVDLPLKPTLELMISLLPKLRKVVVIFGASEFEQTWERATKRAFTSHEKRLELSYWSAEPFAEILERASKLSPDSAILFFGYLQDSNGTTFSSAAAAEQLAKTASVPTFGIFDTYLGTGVLGGKMIDFFGEGQAIGKIVHRVLSGESPEQIGIQPPSLERCAFDSRQLERWKIAEASLPLGSQVLFGKPDLWKEHPVTLTGAVLAILAQSALITSLLVNRVQRKRSERALRASEERYRTVVESQTTMVCRFLADTTLTFVNEAYCRYIGRKREELLGKKFLEFIPPEWHQQVLETVSILATSQQSVRQEHEVLLPNGKLVWHHWENYPIVNQNGQVEEYQAIGQDITAHKRAEELTQNLARSSPLTLLGELTASIGHEINQPLGAILSNAETAALLLESDSPPLNEIRQMIADIRRDDFRAREIIRHIRTLLSKREANMGLLDLNEVAGDIVQFARVEARKRKITIETEFDPKLPPVFGDRVQLQQVLLNFILNGMDAMDEIPPEQRRILVRTDLTEKFDAQFAVSDNGHGIPEKKLPRIFDSFFTTKKKGMGLGLAITRSIAETHGGTVSAENNPGAGATFRFRLPIEPDRNGQN